MFKLHQITILYLLIFIYIYTYHLSFTSVHVAEWLQSVWPQPHRTELTALQVFFGVGESGWLNLFFTQPDSCQAKKRTRTNQIKRETVPPRKLLLMTFFHRIFTTFFWVSNPCWSFSGESRACLGLGLQNIRENIQKTDEFCRTHVDEDYADLKHPQTQHIPITTLDDGTFLWEICFLMEASGGCF